MLYRRASAFVAYGQWRISSRVKRASHAFMPSKPV